MISVLWGLLAALLVGTSDAIARKTTQHCDLNVLTLIVMLMSTTGLTTWLLITGDWPQWHLAAWAASAMSGFLNIVVLYLLFLALRRGPVSVASPSASTFTIMLVGLNAFSGEPWSYTQLAAVVIVFIGVIMLARKSNAPGIDDSYDSKWIRTTALIGLAAALAVSIRMFLAQDANVVLGPIGALFLNRVFGAMVSILIITTLLSKNQGSQLPSRPILNLIALQAALEAGALGVFLVGSVGNGRIGASIGFSAFAAVTAIVASVWLKERIGKSRSIWIMVIVFGLMLASAN